MDGKRLAWRHDPLARRREAFGDGVSETAEEIEDILAPKAKVTSRGSEGLDLTAIDPVVNGLQIGGAYFGNLWGCEEVVGIHVLILQFG